MVWAEAPVRRTRETSPKLTSLEVPVVEKSVPFLVARDLVMSSLPPRLVSPPLTVKVLVPETVVLPDREMPPEPDWTTVVEVPLVEPRVVVWLEAPVPRFKFWPEAALMEAAPAAPKVKALDVKVLVLIVPVTVKLASTATAAVVTSRNLVLPALF